MKLIASLIAFSCLALTQAQTKISFNYQNVKMSDVIYSISKLTETTIVSPQIDTRVNLQAKNVSKQETLEILTTQLNVMSYSMTYEDKFYVVRPLAKIQQEDGRAAAAYDSLVVKTFKLNRSDKNIVEVIQDATRTTARERNKAISIQNANLIEIPPVISWDSDGNHLVARGTQKQINEIEQLIAVLDSGKNTIWTTKIYRLQYAKATYLSPALTKAYNHIVEGTYQASLTSFEYGNCIVVTCPRSYMVYFDKLIELIDTKEKSKTNLYTFKPINRDTMSISNVVIKIDRRF